MAELKAPENADETPRFPYEDTWEEIGGKWVSIESLAANAEEYWRYEELADHLGLELPCPGKDAFEALVAKFDLSPALADQLAENAWLIAGFYLTPKRKKELRNGLDAHREFLAGIAEHSRQLHKLSFRLPPRVREVMQHVRSTEPGVIDRTGPTRKELLRLLHDLSLIAERIIGDIAPQPGRPSEHLRDTTIRLAIEAAQAAGLDDLTVSRDMKASSQSLLRGRAGQFLKGFFALVPPGLSEDSLAPIIERVRRRMKAQALRPVT